MQKGFEMGRLRSAVSVGWMAAAWFTASVTATAVIGLPGRTEQNALSPGAASCCDGDFGATNPCSLRDGPSPQPLPRAEGIVPSA